MRQFFSSQNVFPHFRGGRGGVQEGWKKSTLFISFFFEGFPYVNYNDGAGAKVHKGIVGINMFPLYYTRNYGSILTKNYALGHISYLCFIVNLVLSPVAIICLLKN